METGGGQDNQAKTDDTAALPRWARKIAKRLAKLEDGHVYNVVLVIAGDRTVWAVRPEGKVENEG